MRVARAIVLTGAAFWLVLEQPLAGQVSSVPSRGQVVASPLTLVQRALDANPELAAARLDLERGRARLRQAGLRPNPTLDVERTTGRFTGSPDERELAVGVALPLELGGRRQQRIDVAGAELAVIDAEVADRERELTRAVLAAYIDALSATRELDTTARLLDLDRQIAGVVRVRVDEREAPPLELSLLLTETARLESRQALLRGRVDAAAVALARLVGAPLEPIAVDPAGASLNALAMPGTLEEAIAAALDRRPDMRVARLREDAAQAGVRLARAEAWPEVTVSVAYLSSRGLSELPGPLTAVPDDDKALAFGASIGLPFFNRNEGARADAAVAVRQARIRREAIEQTIRADVASAFRRAAAARAAIDVFDQGVMPRSTDNLRVIRAAYDLGEFRITDVLNEQRRLLDAQQEYTEAIAEHYRALVDLRAAIGLGTLQP